MKKTTKKQTTSKTTASKKATPKETAAEMGMEKEFSELKDDILHSSLSEICSLCDENDSLKSEIRDLNEQLETKDKRLEVATSTTDSLREEIGQIKYPKTKFKTDKFINFTQYLDDPYSRPLPQGLNYNYFDAYAIDKLKTAHSVRVRFKGRATYIPAKNLYEFYDTSTRSYIEIEESDLEKEFDPEKYARMMEKEKEREKEREMGREKSKISSFFSEARVQEICFAVTVITISVLMWITLS